MNLPSTPSAWARRDHETRRIQHLRDEFDDRADLVLDDLQALRVLMLRDTSQKAICRREIVTRLGVVCELLQEAVARVRRYRRNRDAAAQ